MSDKNSIMSEQFEVGSDILSRKFKNLISNTACEKYSSALGGRCRTISAATSAPLAGLCMYACVYVCMYIYGIYTYTVYVCMDGWMYILLVVMIKVKGR